MAQTNVYSLNAVGYINLSLPPGFSMIADQLQSTNNTIGSLMNDAAGTYGTGGAYDGVKIYAWNGTSYTSDSGDSAFSTYANGWDNGGKITMNPGQAVWFSNPNKTNMNVLFLGNVPTGTLPVTITGPSTFNMISSPVPVGGDIVTNSVMNLTNYSDKDKVYVYNNPGGYTTYSVDINFGTSGYLSQWDLPGDPQVAVGQGFWYLTASTTKTFTWTETFSVSQ